MFDGSTDADAPGARLLEDAAGDAHARRRADEHERDVDGDLLAGDELLEVDVQDLRLNGWRWISRISVRVVPPST